VDQAQVGNDVFDLATTVESLRAYQLIRKPGMQEGFFQRATGRWCGT
jgi:hypothetical protein